MMAFTATVRDEPLRSRDYKGPHLLEEVKHLRAKVELSQQIETHADWLLWCRLLAADLDKHLHAGAAMLHGRH